VRYFNFKASEDLKANTCYHYKIADSIYQSNVKIAELEFLIQTQYFDNNISNHVSKEIKNPHQVYSDVAVIGDKQYPLRVMAGFQSDYNLLLKDNNYSITTELINSNFLDTDINILLGPALILNLALNKVFCMHASVFTINTTTFILMANSGTGKSTIARYIHNQSIGKRVGDDIIPLKIKDKGLILLPSFPQLKLSQSQQYQGQEIGAKTIFLFAEKTNNNTSLHTIDTFSGMKKLIQHTVATKLFAQAELKNHLDLCHKASQQIKSYLLKYQHSENSLQQLVDLINELC